MMFGVTAEEMATIRALVRAGEEILWAGRGSRSVETACVPSQKKGMLQRMCALFSSAPGAVQPAADTADGPVYVLLPTRVLEVQGGAVQHEWMLMLGMVQKVVSREDGSGDIVFDYEPQADGGMMPRGLLGVADVTAVRDKLHAAIDAAYMASPWT